MSRRDSLRCFERGKTVTRTIQKSFATPLRIISRLERLVIEDYRPTGLVLLAGIGFSAFVGLLILILMKVGATDASLAPISAVIFLAAACPAVAVHNGTIRKVYVFDRTTNSHAFLRAVDDFLHRTR